MQAFSKTISGCFTTAEAEALALCETLIWLLYLQMENVSMEMDCKLVVDAIHSIQLNLIEFGSLITDCKNLVSRGHNLSICFVKRQTRNVAHSIARVACSHASPSF